MPKTLTTAQAARMLSIGRGFLYDLLQSGKLKGEKQGKRWLILEQSVHERLERLAANSK
jgi:excisionase family DNA binding protein